MPFGKESFFLSTSYWLELFYFLAAKEDADNVSFI